MATRLFLLMVLLGLVTGCGNPKRKIPHQELATAIVWDFFGGTRAPPEIEWIDHHRLNCGEGNRGFYREQIPIEKLYRLPKVCVVGVFWEHTYRIQVEYPPTFSFSDSAFAHELYHAHLYNTYGSGDPEHVAAGFLPGGLVDRADELLEIVSDER